MLNPVFWKEVQGQKHPGRWEIAEHNTPSVKKLFKTNGHKHHSISFIIIDNYFKYQHDVFHLRRSPHRLTKPLYHWRE